MARPVGPFLRHAVLIRDLVALPLTFAGDSTKPPRHRVTLLRKGKGGAAGRASQPAAPTLAAIDRAELDDLQTDRRFFVTLRDLSFAPYCLVFVA